MMMGKSGSGTTAFCSSSSLVERAPNTETRMPPTSFANALFPDSPDSEVLVLAEGGMPEEDRYIDPQLRQLLDETEDFIDSEDFLTVRKTCLDRLFAVLERELEGSFKEPEGAQGQAVNGDAEGKEKSKGKEREGFLHPIQQRFRELEEGEDVDSRVARLASLLPIVARQSHLILNGIPNEYVEVSLFSLRLDDTTEDSSGVPAILL